MIWQLSQLGDGHIGSILLFSIVLHVCFIFYNKIKFIKEREPKIQLTKQNHYFQRSIHYQLLKKKECLQNLKVVAI